MFLYICYYLNIYFFRNPTPSKENLLQNIQWPQTNIGNKFSALDIGNNLKIIKNPHKDVSDFYDPLYVKYGKPPFDTY